MRAVDIRWISIVLTKLIEQFSNIIFLQVGSILYLRDGDQLPADCLLLSTAHPDGICHVETAALDGESNLKVKTAPEDTKMEGNLKALSALQGQVVCNGAGSPVLDDIGGHFKRDGDPRNVGITYTTRCSKTNTKCGAPLFHRTLCKNQKPREICHV